ncbi:MAG: phosphatidylglycerophosphatase A [Candidatus Omnitrophica bacterium]|nr:phosphatidylglycerophosphatase A [Candidatus Omnitrophota bacterium]
MRKFIVKIISTFFYVGYLPLVPGTFASIAGIGLYYLVKDSSFVYSLTTLAALAAGFLTAGGAEEVFHQKDDRRIVIDEVAGMLLSLAFLPYDIKLVVFAFVLFRVLDALKPYPAWRLQNLKGSPGVMSDDIVAGLYTNFILQVVSMVLGKTI